MLPPKKPMAMPEKEMVETETEIESSAPDETPEHESAEGEVTISIESFGGKAPRLGDMLKVTGVDAENGTVSVALPMAGKRGGIDSAVAAFEETE